MSPIEPAAVANDARQSLDWGRIAVWTDAVLKEDFSAIARVYLAHGAEAPTLVWNPTLDHLKSNPPRHLLTHWSSLAIGKRLPDIRQIDPFDLRRALGYVMLMDVVDGGHDFRYRHFGRAISRVSGFDMTGRQLSEHPASTYVTEFHIAVCRASIRRREPVYTARSPVGAQDTGVWERLILPLVDENDHVPLLLVANTPIARDGRLIRTRDAHGPRHLIQLYRALAQYVVRASNLTRQLSTVQAALDTLATAIFVVARDRTVLYANSAAEKLTRRGDGLRLSLGRLCAENPEDDRRLNAEVFAAAAYGVAGNGAAVAAHNLGGALRLTRGGREAALVALVVPAPASYRLSRAFDQPAAIVFVNAQAQEQTDTVSEPLLMRLYGLTRAEARLCAALLDGSSLEAISERFALTVHTLKSQLKQVFAKTDTARQAELIRRVYLDVLVRTQPPPSGQ